MGRHLIAPAIKKNSLTLHSKSKSITDATFGALVQQIPKGGKFCCHTNEKERHLVSERI